MMPLARLIEVVFIATGLLLFQQPVIALQTEHKTTRIVSLDLCSDWMLARYADPSRQVTYSPLLYRYAPAWIPVNLPVHDGSLENILEINPELVITGEFNASLLVKRLRQLHYRVEVLSLPSSLEAISEYLQEFRSILDIHRSDEVLQALKTFPARHQKMLILGANGIAAGKGTLENDLLKKAGWNNYLKSEGFVSLDLEHLVADPPHAIIHTRPLSNSLANLFARHPALSGIPGGEDSTLSDHWRWQCPGPWSFQLVKELAQWKKP